MGDRRSFWAWCMESEEPTDGGAGRAGREAVGAVRHRRSRPDRCLGPRTPSCARRASRCPTGCRRGVRRRRTSGRSTRTAPAFTDRVRAFNLDFPNPPDVVAHPRDEQELEITLDWCDEQRLRGHSVRRRLVGGVGRESARRLRPVRDDRARPSRPRAGDRRGVARRAHPGRRARPGPRDSS